MLTLLLRWVLNAGALMVLPSLLDSIRFTGAVPALIAAIAIGFLNAVLRPALILLTLPAAIVTMGFFVLVINGLMFWGASEIVPGFEVVGFWGAVWGALIYSILSGLVDAALGGQSKMKFRMQRMHRTN